MGSPASSRFRGAQRRSGCGVARLSRRLADPDYYHDLMDFITTALIRRMKVIRQWRWERYPDSLDRGQFRRPGYGFADDAVVLLSLAQYREFVFPYHKRLMDDTSTTLISPAMFEAHNVGLTNRRADLCHAHGKLYLHHSCGLIRHLLPIYRKTRMDGVDAFTAPPVGDVGYAEGREILGPGYAIHAGLCGGLPSLDEQDIRRHVAERLDDARRAGSVAFCVGGAHLTFSAMEMIFSQAQRLKTG